MLCTFMLAARMASEAVIDDESSEPVQKAPRRRKCKNHLVQLAEMFPDVVYNVAAVYGSPYDQIYVIDVQVGGQVSLQLFTDYFESKAVLSACKSKNEGKSEFVITIICNY